MTSGVPAVEEFLRVAAEAAGKLAERRYRDGFRAGVLWAERQRSEGRQVELPKPPPIPREALRGSDHATPVVHVDAPWERKR